MRLFYALPIILLPNALHLPSGLAIAASIVLLIGAAILGPRDPPHLAQSGYLTPPLVGLCLALLVGYIIAQWSDISTAGEDLMRAKYAITYPLLYVAYRRCGLDLKATTQLIMLVLVVAVIAGLEAVFQGLKFNLDEFAEQQRATGPFGVVQMANRAGVFFAIFLPLCVALALQPNYSAFVRSFAFAGAAVLVMAILFTFSRQSYVIALLGILLVLVPRLIHRGVPIAVLALLLIAVGVGVGAGLLPDSVVQRVDDTRQVGAGGTSSYDSSTTSRFEIWKGAAAMVADRPGGVGLGRFREHIGNYSNHPATDAHNSFVLLLAEAGILGMVMMLWLLWRLWGLARKLRRSAVAVDVPEARAIALGFTVTVISMVLGNMYGSAYVEGLVMYNFWILCGLLERYGNAHAHATELLASDRSMSTAAGVATSRFPLAARFMPSGAGATRPLPPR